MKPFIEKDCTIRDLWICTDCLFVLANDDWPDDEETCQSIRDGIEREAPAHWALDGPTAGEEACADQMEFSKSPCDCCGSRLGGSRHRAALIT